MMSWQKTFLTWNLPKKSGRTSVQDHPVWSRLSKLEEDVALLKSNIPPSS